jgi:hypothetical protein
MRQRLRARGRADKEILSAIPGLGRAWGGDSSELQAGKGLARKVLRKRLTDDGEKDYEEGTSQSFACDGGASPSRG